MLQNCYIHKWTVKHLKKGNIASRLKRNSDKKGIIRRSIIVGVVSIYKSIIQLKKNFLTRTETVRVIIYTVFAAVKKHKKKERL